MDQTGVHLVPADARTFESIGSKDVKVIGGEDKRQITACIGSSLNGDLLPMQLIFTGTTSKCLPAATPSSQSARVHLTHTDNHWSSQETMQQWVREVLQPYIERQRVEFNLAHSPHVVLVLDVWSVHKSKEFITFLSENFPRVHLVFVPANCTSRLQVADVVLQRPFKHGIKKEFNEWAAQIITEQINSDAPLGLNSDLGMKKIKPLALQWCVTSWTSINNEKGRELIKVGWIKCCTQFFDVLDRAKRVEAVEEAQQGKIDFKHIPQEDESAAAVSEESNSEDDNKDVLDVMQERKYGERKSTRKRTRTIKFGGGVNPAQIDCGAESGEDSEADGMCN